MDRKKMIIADLGLLLTAFVWGSGFVAVKNALDSMSPMYIMVIRFGIAAMLTGLIFFKRIIRINAKDLTAGIIIGLFMFLGFTTQTIGMQFTLAGKGAFLTGTNVVMVPFIYWAVSKDKPDKYNLIAAIIMFVGIGFLTLNLKDGFTLNRGDILNLICAFFFACHIVSVGYYASKHDPIILAFVQFTVTFLLSGLYSIAFEEFTIGVPENIVLQAIYLGLFSTFLAFLIQNVAQKYTSASHASLILCLESFFGSILSVFFLGETFSFNMILGCILILTAIITAETKWKFLHIFNNNSDENTVYKL